MRRRILQGGIVAGWLILAGTGCTTRATYANGGQTTWVMPWQTPVHHEEYKVPPLSDTRYSEPPTFPKHTMQPMLKPQFEDKSPAARGRPLGSGPLGAAGGIGNGF